jgi:hypothetical protein
MTRSRLFLKALLPRLALSVLFSSMYFLGPGGDAEVYHLVGVHVKDRWVNPRSRFEEVLIRWGWDNPQPFEMGSVNVAILNDAVNRGATGTWMNNTLPVIWIHAALYLIWENQFMFVLFTSILSAWAVSRFVRSFGMPARDARWLLYNPASIFFAATHFKESIVESLILFSVTLWYRENRHIAALWPAILAGMFRTSYVPLIALILGFKFIRAVPARLILPGLLVLLAVLPPFYWSVEAGAAGRLYSLVNRSDMTKKTLGPLVGLIQPVPFLNMGDFWTTLFFTAYGITYLVAVSSVMIWIVLNERADVFVTSSMVANIVVGYYTIGMSFTKARYFAPFFPILLLGYLRIRGDLRRSIKSALGMRPRAHLTRKPRPT